jgi:2,3-bisphosphoglycerate-independent phosphoglycerate mutase
MSNKRIGLIILDGWGIGDGSSSDAITQANTPYMDSLMQKYPSAQLLTCGEHVGLPEGQMGNSEVGHLNIGAGRIVYQELTRINKSIKDGEFFENNVLVNAFQKAKAEGKKVHFLGLVSEGGVHSSQEHLHALCDLAMQFELENVFIHAFTDGRDCDPQSGRQFLKNLCNHIEGTPIKIASVIGRYYAMDRDKRWERVEKAYDLMVKGEGQKFVDVDAVFEHNYGNGVTDEFIEPSVLTQNEVPIATIEDGDIVVSFNFRTDRPREIVLALSQQDFHEYDMQALNVHLITMTAYDDTYTNVHVVFEKDNLSMTLGEVLSNAGLSQIRIAETEKYPHVTFFFSGGRETEFTAEHRILVNSPKVATYDLQPEMSAFEVTEKIIDAIHDHTPDFFCLNFANPDMVGHTGVYDAIVKAVETVDGCLKLVVEAAQQQDFEVLVIADHGNADFTINADGSPNTAHSLNPVPVVLVTSEEIQLNNGILADVAPTILHRMGVKQPEVMTGKSLLKMRGSR